MFRVTRGLTRTQLALCTLSDAVRGRAVVASLFDSIDAEPRLAQVVEDSLPHVGSGNEHFQQGARPSVQLGREAARLFDRCVRGVTVPRFRQGHGPDQWISETVRKRKAVDDCKSAGDISLADRAQRVSP